jgi:hypothetical protein
MFMIINLIKKNPRAFQREGFMNIVTVLIIQKHPRRLNHDDDDSVENNFLFRIKAHYKNYFLKN